MARPLRIEYAGAIYHVMSRGNARQAIFIDGVDRQKLLEGLEDTVTRYGWEVLSFVFMPNHIHHIARAVAAWLARRLTTATLRELAGPLGLGRPESVSNLTRRVDRDMAKSSQLRKDLRALESRIVRKTKNKV